jgi:hypothetical protein
VNSSQDPQTFFRVMLQTVVGQAYAAAGYQLEDLPIQWAGGLFRFKKPLTTGLHAYILYQHLAYAEPNPSRFRVTLVRSDQTNPNMTSRHPQFLRRTLSMLVVRDFGVAILPSDDHWWHYRSVTEMGSALAEAGHLVAGYGIPWLAGDLHPPVDPSPANPAL